MNPCVQTPARRSSHEEQPFKRRGAQDFCPLWSYLGGSSRTSEEIEGGHFGQVRRLRGSFLESEEIEGGHFWKVRRLRGVIFGA